MTDYAPGLEAAFARVPEERCRAPVRAEGSIPGFLRGTYYLNGPARFERSGFRYQHWLDGDGMVCALRFAAEGVDLTSRFVRGGKWCAEEQAGRPLFRAFGTAFGGDRLARGGIALESPLNVSVYPYGDTLLAFGEQGRPWELDPISLDTRGEFTFGGRLGPVAPFAAHPKIDAETGELFNFGVSFAAGGPQLHFYRFDAESSLIYRKRLPLPGPCSIHDFALSGAHAVFHVSPYHLDMESLVKGSSILDSLRWHPEEGSELRILSRETGEQVASIPIGQRYCLHTINAFEAGGRLVVDLLELDRPVYDEYRVPDLFVDVAPGRPVRRVIDLERGSQVESREIPYERAPDFAAMDPRRYGLSYEDFWMLGISTTGRPGRKFFDELVHARWNGPLDVWHAPPGVYLAGEPSFAEGGAILCPLYDAVRDRSSFAVFEADHVAKGPFATLHLEAPIHLAFHGVFKSA